MNIARLAFILGLSNEPREKVRKNSVVDIGVNPPKW